MLVEDHFYQIDALRLYYQRHIPEDEQYKRTLLCLPGLTRNHQDFSALIPHLENHYQIICPDLRGRGKSDYDPHPTNYGLEVYVEDILALLDQLDIDCVDIIGTSLGGILAMIIASEQPQRINKVILNDIGAYVPLEPLQYIAEYVKASKPFNSWTETANTLKLVSKTSFTDLTDNDWLKLAKRGYVENGSGLICPDYDPALADTLNPQALDLWPYFDSLLAVPILLLRGENSLLLTPDIINEMKMIKPDMKVVCIPNRGHTPFLDEAPAIQAINEFLRN